MKLKRKEIVYAIQMPSGGYYNGMGDFSETSKFEEACFFGDKRDCIDAKRKGEKMIKVEKITTISLKKL